MGKRNRKVLHRVLLYLMLAVASMALAASVKGMLAWYFAAWAGASLVHMAFYLYAYIKRNDADMLALHKRRHIEEVDERKAMLRQLSGFQTNKAMHIVLAMSMAIASLLWLLDWHAPYAQCVMVGATLLLWVQNIIGKIAYARNEARY